MAAKTSSDPPRRMACWNCPRYSRMERRCADGKTNPKKKADCVEVAEVLGLRALCHYNPYRDALAARMYFPRSPLGINSVPPRRPRKKRFGELTRPEPETVLADDFTGKKLSMETQKEAQKKARPDANGL